jgi:hypothetical protein
LVMARGALFLIAPLVFKRGQFRPSFEFDCVR